MPFQKLAFILACVIAAAAATVYLVMSLAQRGELPANGLVVLGVLALCASFAWRRYSDRKRDDT